MSAITTVIILSFAAEPTPERHRAPRKDVYEVAVACQMLEPIVISEQTSKVFRLPNISIHGIIIKFVKPRVMITTPV
jgi:hypothetical protein